MNDLKPALDRRGQQLRLDDVVELLEIPAWLPRGLLDYDQIAIKAQVGKCLRIAGFDAIGNVELEFEEPRGAFHTIWIDPDCLLRKA